jgi:hypothetical protein
MLPKTDKLAQEMCEQQEGTGTTINMDSYYTYIITAIYLKQRKIYCRGTIQCTRKYLPKSILFTAKEARELPRGYMLYAQHCGSGMN